MENSDKIKRAALSKLVEFSKGELKYLEDNNLKIKNFSVENMLENCLSEEEKKEVANSLEQLKDDPLFFCKSQGINVPDKLL